MERRETVLYCNIRKKKQSYEKGVYSRQPSIRTNFIWNLESYTHTVSLSWVLTCYKFCIPWSQYDWFCEWAMQVSYMILARVSPVTHSVGNCVKRVVVIVSSVIFFQTPVSPINAIGKVASLWFQLATLIAF